jgi:glycosyltransferase involved in cell wall biosynthesis
VTSLLSKARESADSDLTTAYAATKDPFLASGLEEPSCRFRFLQCLPYLRERGLEVAVATCVGSVPELVEDDVTGLLVPPQKPEAMAAALRRLIAEPLLRTRLGIAGAQRVRQEFTLPRMIAETESIYQDALRAGLGR